MDAVYSILRKRWKIIMGHESSDSSSGTERTLDSTALPQAKNSESLRRVLCFLVGFFPTSQGRQGEGWVPRLSSPCKQQPHHLHHALKPDEGSRSIAWLPSQKVPHRSLISLFISLHRKTMIEHSCFFFSTDFFFSLLPCCNCPGCLLAPPLQCQCQHAAEGDLISEQCWIRRWESALFFQQMSSSLDLHHPDLQCSSLTLIPLLRRSF